MRFKRLIERIVTEGALCSVYAKTLDYVKTFAKWHTTDSASAVREYVASVPFSYVTNIGPPS